MMYGFDGLGKDKLSQISDSIDKSIQGMLDSLDTIINHLREGDDEMVVPDTFPEEWLTGRTKPRLMTPEESPFNWEGLGPWHPDENEDWLAPPEGWDSA